jgi:putative ABC transport system permease protein
MNDVLQDLRQSLRTFLNHPGFAGTVVATLALSIGANAAIFSLVYAVLLRPVPFPDPDRIVMFSSVSPQGVGVVGSPTKFNLWRKDTETFHDVSAYFFGTINLVETDNPEQLGSGHVSASFFRLFGASMTSGRTFTPEEDVPNGGDVAVLGYRFWQRRFGSAADVIGKTIPLNDRPHLIIGVLGRDFDPESLHEPFGATEPIDVWVPLQADPATRSQGNNLLVAGRLAPGATLAMANARLRAATTEFRSLYPQAIRPGEEFRARPLHEVVVNDVRTPLLVLLGAVGFVLLLACANVANMVLIRALGRQREMAIRAALGASRGRIIRQLLTESLVLSLLGGALGLAVGTIFLRALLAMSPIPVPGAGTEGAGTSAGWPVVAFTFFVAMLTGLAFGMFPALRTARALKLNESGRAGTGGTGHSSARAVLVVAEAAMALLLVVGAALLIRTFIAMRTVDAGFNAQRVVTLRMSLTDSRMSTTAAVDRLVQDGVQRLAALPGVTAAGATCCLPLENDLGLRFVIDGRALDGAYHGMAGWRFASPAYFEVFDIPLLRGRRFADSDRAGALPVVIINQALARQYWRDGDPIGQRLIIGRGIGPEFEDPVREIIGVVGDVRDGSLTREPRPIMYVPLAQVPDGLTAMNNRFLPLAWIVRTSGDPAALDTQVEQELRKAGPGLPTARLRTMNEIVAQSTGRAEFNMVIVTIFGGVALLLAAIGIYGLMAHSVQQRTREMGIRLALGARPATLRRLVVWQGTRLALLGAVIGLIGAFGLTRFMKSVLFGVTPLDPLVFIGVPVLLSGVASIAAWLPARRVSRIDPVRALRVE